MKPDPFQTLVLEGFDIIRSQMQSVINSMAAAKQEVPSKLDENYRKLCKLCADAKQYVEEQPAKTAKPLLNPNAPTAE